MYFRTRGIVGRSCPTLRVATTICFGAISSQIKMKDGRIDRYKSRLVVDGSKQVSGIDNTNNFAPVVKHTTVRMFLAIAAVHSMCVHQLDVESAFIYAPLHEDVYIHPHPAMNIPHGNCVKLLKSLYGLKQSPRNWNTHLHEFMLSIGLRRSQLNHFMYIGVIESHCPYGCLCSS